MFKNCVFLRRQFPKKDFIFHGVNGDVGLLLKCYVVYVIERKCFYRLRGGVAVSCLEQRIQPVVYLYIEAKKYEKVVTVLSQFRGRFISEN